MNTLRPLAFEVHNESKGANDSPRRNKFGWPEHSASENRDARREHQDATARVTHRAWGHWAIEWLSMRAATSAKRAWRWLQVGDAPMPAWVLHAVDDEAFDAWVREMRAARARGRR